MKKIVLAQAAMVMCIALYGQSTKNYKIRSYFTVDIPTTLELRDTPGVAGQQYCFWPGSNSSKYARILVQMEENPGLTQEDLKYATAADREDVRTAFLNEIRRSGMSPSKVKIHMTDIKKVGSKYAIIKKYTRPGLNGDVYCETYDYYVGKVHIQLTLSYRTSEASYWKADFDKVVDSIVWKI